MKVEINGNQLTIVCEISPRPSKTGKTMVIATTSGNVATTLLYDGKPVFVGVNAYIPRS